MGYTVIYKKRFLNKLDELLIYLEKEWPSETGIDFLSILDNSIIAIKNNPFIGKTTLSKTQGVL